MTAYTPKAPGARSRYCIARYGGMMFGYSALGWYRFKWQARWDARQAPHFLNAEVLSREEYEDSWDQANRRQKAIYFRDEVRRRYPHLYYRQIRNPELSLPDLLRILRDEEEGLYP
jgi:hypothetical protein